MVSQIGRHLQPVERLDARGGLIERRQQRGAMPATAASISAGDDAQPVGGERQRDRTRSV